MYLFKIQKFPLRAVEFQKKINGGGKKKRKKVILQNKINNSYIVNLSPPFGHFWNSPNSRNKYFFYLKKESTFYSIDLYSLT